MSRSDLQSSSPLPHDLITAADAAARLGITRARVYVLIGEGRLAAIKAGRDWLIASADLAAVQERPNGYPRGRPRKKTAG